MEEIDWSGIPSILFAVVAVSLFAFGVSVMLAS
jgi:hypothetical protein